MEGAYSVCLFCASVCTLAGDISTVKDIPFIFLGFVFFADFAPVQYLDIECNCVMM
jgi:hypothetical protein